MGINEVYIIYIDTYFAGNYVIAATGELSSCVETLFEHGFSQEISKHFGWKLQFLYPQDFSPFEVDCLTNMII